MAQRLFDVGMISFTRKALKLCEEYCLDPTDFVREHESLMERTTAWQSGEGNIRSDFGSIFVITKYPNARTLVLLEGETYDV